MTHDAPAVFEAHAADYDALRRRLIPPYDAFYGTAVDAVALAASPPRRVLDLGAGTGILSLRVAAAFPDAELVLIDAAPAMLDRAATALGSRATCLAQDLRDPLPDGPFDAVVSSLAIHHLDDDDKRDLLARVTAVLAPGGVFVNAEQVAGGTPWLDAHHHEWHRRASAALGTTPDEWAATEGRMAFDRCATAEDQLAWMRAAGLHDVTCLLQDHRFAVLFGRRAG